MYKSLVLVFSLLILGTYLIYRVPTLDDSGIPAPSLVPLWSIRSIDTMKYSRDLAREKGSDQNFDEIIDSQLKAIASTGASHVAIATPYDEEFVPYLARWVQTARKYNLKVWFRGNFSGWEGWFDHKRISRSDHLTATTKFITAHATLFKDGDLFTPCPECENGGPGDPRKTGDIAGHRQFLADSTQVGKDAFAKIGKKVEVGYHSMNYDVAMAVMDKETTKKVGGIVAIDHYVASIDKMVKDIDALKERSGGKVFLGEFGAPIPDLNGNMTETQQATWIRDTLSRLVEHKSVVGLNYWVAVGGSTELWDDSMKKKEGVDILTNYYSRLILQGQ